MATQLLPEARYRDAFARFDLCDTRQHPSLFVRIEPNRCSVVVLHERPSRSFGEPGPRSDRPPDDTSLRHLHAR
jgi:hypothetical protein